MEQPPKTRSEELLNHPRVKFYIDVYTRRQNEHYLDMLRNPDQIQAFFEEVVEAFPEPEDIKALEKIKAINEKHKTQTAPTETAEKFVVDKRIINKIDDLTFTTGDVEAIQALTQARKYGLNEAKSKDDVKKVLVQLFDELVLSEKDFMELVGYLEGKVAEDKNAAEFLIGGRKFTGDEYVKVHRSDDTIETDWQIGGVYGDLVKVVNIPLKKEKAVPIDTFLEWQKPEPVHEAPTLGEYENEGEKLTDIELLAIASELYHDKEGDISLTGLEAALRIGTSRAVIIKELLDRKRAENIKAPPTLEPEPSLTWEPAPGTEPKAEDLDFEWGDPDEEEIKRAQEAIIAARKRLAQLDLEDKIDDFETKLAKKKKELKDKLFGGSDKEVKLLEIQIDRLRQPLKYFVVDQIDPKNFQEIFGVKMRDASLEALNEILGNMEEDFNTEAKFIWQPADPQASGIVEFSSNGFYLALANKSEIKKRGEVDFKDERARYYLVNPDGIIGADNLTLTDGQVLLRRMAKEYYKRTVDEFRRKNPDK